MTISYHYKLKSHPDRFLQEHLLGVHHRAISLFDKLTFNFPNFNRDELKEVISVAALFHDFGKATIYFQDYLSNPEKPSTEDSRKKRSHGLVSALLTFGILKEKLPDSLILQLLGLIIVRRHHGNLKDFNHLVLFNEGDLKNVIVQVENLDFLEYQNIVKYKGYDKFVNKDFVLQSVQYFKPRTPREIKRLSRKFTLEHYFVLNLLYSILLQADKTDAILKDGKVTDSKILHSDDVNYFKSGLENNPENPIDAIRESAFISVEETIKYLDVSDRILSINIPTGSGKTISSLNAALKLCEKFDHDHVVYCLPFTSVIDQNFKVFDEIRKSANLPDDTGILLKHHHLTDIFYQSVEDENAVKEYSPNEALHLIEGWESKITVTTFVQLIYSLISYKNSSLRKFNRFSNAVIILDEIQSIPHEYWDLVKIMLSKMAIWLNSKIILVTATMPLIFSEQENEIKELVSGKEKMFKTLNRIELDVSNLDKEKMDWESFCNSAVKLVSENPTKDILFVMNTIRTTRELYEKFSNKKNTHQLEFLSSHIIPKHRLTRITNIKDKKHNKPVLVISTQLVEAGVDIDLDIVVRDFAPLDNIFQTCGRCNRESRDGVKGKVILYSLKDSNSWTPSGIYKDFLKQKTMKVLKGKEIIPESEFYDLANQYFNEIKIGGSQSPSVKILEKIERLKYKDGDEKIEMKLIDDDFSSSIYVELDNSAKQIWKNYQKTLEMENGFDKNVALKQARRNLGEYVINIPKKCLPNEQNNGIYHLRKNCVLEYYNEVTGFNIDSELPPEQSSTFL
ncbi:MAG: CRISPR-associated helicase Cas3', partial [Nitrosopumilus sp.]